MNSLSLFQSKNIGEDKFHGMRPGWTIKVFQKIKEGEKTRIQAFEGLIMSRKHNKESGATITIRKVSDGIGVEKIFPIYLPSIDRVQVLRKTKVRRAKLYYLKDKSAREIRRKTRNRIEKTIS